MAAAGRRLRGGAAALLMPLAVAPAIAQTRAGTAITNVATLYRDGVAVPSNSVSLIVAERLDVALARTPAADAALPAGGQAIGVTLTNHGSGEESFIVSARVQAGSVTVASPIPAGTAEPLPVGGRTRPLAPGESMLLLIPVSSVAAGTVLALSAHATTGSGAPGLVFPGSGDGGGDAVVGGSGAAADLLVPLAAPGTAASVEKSQAVLAPDGSPTPVRGATVTYTLVVRFAGAVADATLVDPIPAGTAYRPGSLVLDGSPLADADHVAQGQVSVALGDATAGTVRTLRFAVVIS
jgi:uncharacterized repeat protein (TIGR01451 family)